MLKTANEGLRTGIMKEVEVRSFLSQDEYDRLLIVLEKEGEKIKEDRQITVYFSGEKDLRIQKNTDSAKIWMKGGELHDESREEVEVILKNNQFEETRRLFEALGYEVEIKWYRKRNKFRWEGHEVCVDHTIGYGRVIEVEELCEEGEEAEALERVSEALEELGVKKTSKREFDERFRHYRKNWQKILREKDLSKFEDL